MDFIIDCILCLLWLAAELVGNWAFVCKNEEERQNFCCFGIIVLFIALCVIVGAAVWVAFG